MFSHMTVGSNDLHASAVFYDAVLTILGHEKKFLDDHWAGWKPVDADRPLFIVTTPYDGHSATTGNGQMVAFMAASRELVDRAYGAAISLGGQDEGAPGLRLQYHPAYYGAYLRDPDGNKLCICCHASETSPDAHHTI